MKKMHVFILLMCFSVVSYAFVPAVVALLGQNAIRTGVTRLVASRAMQVAANDAVYLTVVNSTRAGLNKSISNLLKNQSFLKTVNGLATFAFIAEQFNHDDITKEITYKMDGSTIISGELNLVNYKYYTPLGSGGTAPYLFSNSLDSLANDSFLYDTENGLILNSCNQDNCRFANLRDLKIVEDLPVYIASARYDYEYKSYSGEWVESDGSYSKVLRKNPEFSEVAVKEKIINVDDSDGKYITTKQLANAINSLMMDASLSSDYKGMPYSSNNAFKESELNDIFKIEKIPLKELLKTFEPYPELKTLGELKLETNMDITLKPDINPDKPKTDNDKIDLSYPDNSFPELDTPTAEQIIAPLNNFFPDLKNLEFNERQTQCPTASFEVFGGSYTFDSHCELIEKIKDLITMVSLFSWSFLGLRIILSS